MDEMEELNQTVSFIRRLYLKQLSEDGPVIIRDGEVHKLLHTTKYWKEAKKSGAFAFDTKATWFVPCEIDEHIWREVPDA